MGSNNQFPGAPLIWGMEQLWRDMTLLFTRASARPVVRVVFRLARGDSARGDRPNNSADGPVGYLQSAPSHRTQARRFFSLATEQWSAGRVFDRGALNFLPPNPSAPSLPRAASLRGAFLFGGA
jgi:hypothetical protein